MTDHDDRPFSEEEVARLRTYPVAPGDLEDRIVAAVRETARPARAGRRKVAGLHKVRNAIAIAACALLAFALGRWTATVPAADRGAYLLLIQSAPGEDRLREDEVSRRVGEFAAWARDLRAKGLLTSAEKLENGGEVLSAGARAPLTPADQTIGGFFVIRASSPAEAASIAKGAPHLRHGGRIVLRPLDHRAR